jgi:hypothetical protein
MEYLRDAVTTESIEKGLIGRFVFASGDDRVRLRLIDDASEFPKIAIDRASIIKSTVLMGNLTFEQFSNGIKPKNIKIAYGPGCSERVYELNEHFEDFKELKTGNIEKAIIARSMEKLLRIAGVLAVWENPRIPVITLDMLEWAKAFITASNDHVFALSKEMEVSREYRVNLRVLEFIKRLLSGGLETRYQKGFIAKKQGLAICSDIAYYANMNKRALTEVIDTLLHARYIIPGDKKAREEFGECYRLGPNGIDR